MALKGQFDVILFFILSRRLYTVDHLETEIDG